MEFEIGKKYNFFDDGKISILRHYIAEVKDIIPFHVFYMSNFIKEVIQDHLDYNPIYIEDPQEVIICTINDYIKGQFFFIKMSDNTGNYFSVNDVYWDGKLCTKQWCLENIVNNKDSNPELIKQLVL